jgi:hypothetical protein
MTVPPAATRHAFCNYTVEDRWAQLLGRRPAADGLAAAPDENPCCFPESRYH